MSLENMNTLLIALEAVKGYYTCRVCKEFCRKPVTLKCCFHLICEEHIAELINCPKCDKTLLDQPIFKVENLEASVNSTFELEKIFSQYKTHPHPIDEATNKNVTIRATRNAKKTATNKDMNPELRQSTEKDTSKISQQSTMTIKNRKDIDKRNKNGETPLHVSCRHGNIDKIQELLNQGANSNTKDYAGWTPLHEAVQTDRLDVVKLLLNNKTLINVPGPDNETPLHEAVKYNHKEIVYELIIHGADLNSKNSKGETPKQLANNEMKKIINIAMENVIKNNINNLSSIEMDLFYDDIKVYCVTQYRTVQNKLKTLAKHHKITIESKFTKKVTHLIVDAEEGICMSSLDILQGIVYGIWILSSDWIIKSTDNQLEDFEKYEIKIGTDKYNGAKISRHNKYKQLPDLFNGCHFYLHNFNTSYESNNLILNKTVLTKLITDAGGKVLRRLPKPESIPDNEKLVPYHGKKGGKLDVFSHYIIFKDIYEPKYNMRHLKALPITWLLECIEKYELCEPE